MTTPNFTAMPNADATHYWAGGMDAYGNPPETMISPGGGMPCRHCLSHIAEGDGMLVLAYRPFPALQPYAETGPIFLHAEPCPRYSAEDVTPPILETSPDYIVRGYGADDRIVYGSGAVTAADQILARARELFKRCDIAYLHVRSARNNCYQCRIDRKALMND